MFGAGLKLGQLHPHQRDLRRGIEFLDVIFQRRFIVFIQEAQIAAIDLGGIEIEVTRVQPQQHQRRSGLLLQRQAAGSGIKRNFFPCRPVAVPPRVRQLRCHQNQEKGEQYFSHCRCSQKCSIVSYPCYRKVNGDSTRTYARPRSALLAFLFLA